MCITSEWRPACSSSSLARSAHTTSLKFPTSKYLPVPENRTSCCRSIVGDQHRAIESGIPAGVPELRLGSLSLGAAHIRSAGDPGSGQAILPNHHARDSVLWLNLFPGVAKLSSDRKPILDEVVGDRRTGRHRSAGLCRRARACWLLLLVFGFELTYFRRQLAFRGRNRCCRQLDGRVGCRQRDIICSCLGPQVPHGRELLRQTYGRRVALLMINQGRRGYQNCQENRSRRCPPNCIEPGT